MSQRRKIIPYNPELKELARTLRKNMTLSEVLLWNELKQKNISGYDFDRQRPIDNCIVDFYCKELSLAIEIDGDTHINRYDYDEERQKPLEKPGDHFLSFKDTEVKKNMSNGLRVIQDWISKNKPTPDPSREGNSVRNDRIKKNEPTPDPSREGNSGRNDHIKKNEPTPDPPINRSRLSGKGNSGRNDRLNKNIPTSYST